MYFQIVTDDVMLVVLQKSRDKHMKTDFISGLNNSRVTLTNQSFA